jgi:hypothetical protein
LVLGHILAAERAQAGRQQDSQTDHSIFATSYHPTTSASGQSRTKFDVRIMSAFLLKKPNTELRKRGLLKMCHFENQPDRLAAYFFTFEMEP